MTKYKVQKLATEYQVELGHVTLQVRVNTQYFIPGASAKLYEGVISSDTLLATATSVQYGTLVCGIIDNEFVIMDSEEENNVGFDHRFIILPPSETDLVQYMANMYSEWTVAQS
jgi:hypothetical protein